jgi:hypothetical protein
MIRIMHPRYSRRYEALRLHSKRLQSHDPALILIHRYNVVFCPCAFELYPEDLDCAVACLLHRVDDLLVLEFEAWLLDLFDVVASDELLQVIYEKVLATI